MSTNGVSVEQLMESLLNADDGGRHITDGNGGESMLMIRGMCSIAPNTRLSYAYPQSETPYMTSIINAMPDDLHDVHVAIYDERDGKSGKLVQITENGVTHSALISVTDDDCYKIKFDTEMPEAYRGIPLAAMLMDSNDEFKQAFEDMCNTTLDVATRKKAAGVASDAFRIMSQEVDECEMAFGELTPAMIGRYIQTGEYGQDTDDKVAVKYDAIVHYDQEAALRGDYRIPPEVILGPGQDWTPEEKAMIPSLSELELYVPIKDFHKIFTHARKQFEAAKAIAKPGEKIDGVALRKTVKNMLFQGDPGSGKSQTAKVLGAIYGLPVWEVTFSQNAEENAVEGKTRISKGQLDFTESAIQKGWRRGGIVVLDEINLADPGVTQGTLGPALEHPYEITNGATGVREQRNPFTLVVGTMNIDLAGTNPMSEALDSRFKHHFTIDAPSRDDMIAIIEKGADIDHEKAAYIYKCYDQIRNYLIGNHMKDVAATKLTLRHCIGAAEEMDPAFDCSPKEAIRDSMLNQLDQVQRGLADEIYATL